MPRIPEKDLRLLSVGLAVELRAAAYPDAKYRGTVDMIAPEIDTEGGAVHVRIRLEQGDPPLRPGLFLSGHIVTDEKPNALLVPKSGLKYDRDRTYIYVAERKNSDQPKARKIYLRRGLQDQDFVEYLPLNGKDWEIDDNTEIAVAGIDDLVDGAILLIEDGDNSRDGPSSASGNIVSEGRKPR